MCSCLGLNIKACERTHNLDQQQLTEVPDIPSSEDHYSRDPVQVQSSTNAMFTITNNAK
jgi:hypothetical protein